MIRDKANVIMSIHNNKKTLPTMVIGTILATKITINRVFVDFDIRSVESLNVRCSLNINVTNKFNMNTSNDKLPQYKMASIKWRGTDLRRIAPNPIKDEC